MDQMGINIDSTGKPGLETSQASLNVQCAFDSSSLDLLDLRYQLGLWRAGGGPRLTRSVLCMAEPSASASSHTPRQICHSPPRRVQGGAGAGRKKTGLVWYCFLPGNRLKSLLKNIGRALEALYTPNSSSWNILLFKSFFFLGCSLLLLCPSFLILKGKEEMTIFLSVLVIKRGKDECRNPEMVLLRPVTDQTPSPRDRWWKCAGAMGEAGNF